MLDKSRLFKIFEALSTEASHFFVAQDAYPILASINTQLDSLDAIITEHYEKMGEYEGSEEKAGEHKQYEVAIAALKEVIPLRPTLQSVVNTLMPSALEFWFCAPVDNVGTSNTASSRSAIERWRIYQGHHEEIPTDILQKIDEFRKECDDIVHKHFETFFVEKVEEEKLEADAVGALPKFLKHASYIPLGIMREFDESNDSVTVVSDFPISHFLVPDPRFAKLIGYCVARLLTVPLLTFIVNTADTGELISLLNADDGTANSAAIVFYRSSTREVLAIHWEIAKKLINGHVIAQGVNITKDLERARTGKIDDTEQLLRKWLHSIRNASFQQQAEVISQDINTLKEKIGEKSEFTEDFDNINNGLNTLIYTTRASICLIDQVLDSRALSNFSPVREFVSAIIQFPVNFAKSEGIEDLPNSFNLYLNGVVATPQALKGLYVSGDLSTLTAIIDNIFSNAVRYTDYSVGVYADMHIHIHDTNIQLVLSISDHCPGGLPDHIVNYLKQHLSREQVVDLRAKDKSRIGSAMAYGSDQEGNSDSCRSSEINTSSEKKSHESEFSIEKTASDHIPQGNGRSSETGIPHIVEIYHELTRSGELDFNMAITVKPSGTTFLISSAFGLVAPPALLDNDDLSGTDDASITSERQRKKDTEGAMLADKRPVLIVDDSHVVRRILERYIKRVGIPCHSCKDGVEAWNWFKENHENCRGIITDLEMPKMGGDMLISLVLEMKPSTPCVVVSGNNIAAANVPEGALRSILKPITMDQTKDVLIEMHDFFVDNLRDGKHDSKARALARSNTLS